MLKSQLSPDLLHELKRALSRATDKWSHRGVMVTLNGEVLCEMKEIADAALIVMLHNNGLTLLNEVIAVRKENLCLMKQNKSLLKRYLNPPRNNGSS